ncbi:hypothetical protein BSKO_07443 [Bryopsis sp. KO-2023]|nr:hypothetical protein BSKO_07443 [Bryopsis sp. KO-2023]
MASRAVLLKNWLTPDVYPLLTAVGAGMFVSAYAGARCLYKNPEVLISKNIRNDQLAESDWFLEKSGQYRKSFFRTIGESYGSPSIFPNDAVAAAK